MKNYSVSNNESIASKSASPAELVKKIETSASFQRRRRLKQQRRKVKALVRINQNQARREGKYAIVMTLTFANDNDFSPKCMRAFTDKFRRWMKRRGYSLQYVWVLERQSRIHYHLVLWLPRGMRVDFDLLAKWWPWGKTWTENCRNPRAWGAYMAKFDSPDGSFRKNTRLYGSGGLDVHAKLEWRRANLPFWLQRILPEGEQARRVRGGGWASVDTGVVYFSPYVWDPLGMLALAARTHSDAPR